jgi:hypothetical protein
VFETGGAACSENVHCHRTSCPANGVSTRFADLPDAEAAAQHLDLRAGRLAVAICEWHQVSIKLTI